MAALGCITGLGSLALHQGHLGWLSLVLLFLEEPLGPCPLLVDMQGVDRSTEGPQGSLEALSPQGPTAGLAGAQLYI